MLAGSSGNVASGYCQDRLGSIGIGQSVNDISHALLDWLQDDDTTLQDAKDRSPEPCVSFTGTIGRRQGMDDGRTSDWKPRPTLLEGTRRAGPPIMKSAPSGLLAPYWEAITALARGNPQLRDR
jgi:hypothetical protein